MKRSLVLFITLIAGVQFLFGGFIDAKEAAKLLKSGDAIIVSTRPAEDYAKKHIDGAVNVDLNALYNPEGIKVMLKPAEEIAKYLGEKGITPDKKIIVYDTGSNKAAGRLYWILEYMGAKNVDILNGHITGGWAKARGKMSAKINKVEPVTFAPAVDGSKYASMEYVKSNMKKDGVMLVDVRSSDEFNGKEKDDANITRKGHIPGAVNFVFDTVINSDGTVKSKDDIAKLLQTAGISGDKEIILYCASSVRAGIVYAVLTSVMDFKKVRVYDGAYYEWNATKDNPVE